MARRWDHIEALLAADSLTPIQLDVIGKHISTQSLPGLRTLEGELASIANTELKRLLAGEQLDTLAEGEIAAILRISRHLETETRSNATETRAEIRQVSELPFGRDEWLRELRAFATRDSDDLMVLNGLQAIGKSTIVSAALQQSGARVLSIDCKAGTTADFLYEVTLRAGGRVPTGTSPRTSFSADDLADALRPFDVYWLKDVHNLTEYGNWRNNGLEQFVTALIDGYRAAEVALLFESRRGVNLPIPLGRAPLRRRVMGLAERDGVALLEQRLRRAKVPLDTVPPQLRAQIVQQVDGHPGMIILCADACCRAGADAVIRDLRGRRGFYLAAVEKLIKDIGFSQDEMRCVIGLSQCREPIVPTALAKLVPESQVANITAELSDSCLIERDRAGRIRLAGLMQDLSLDIAEIESGKLRAFHAEISRDFESQYQKGKGVSSYVAAIEANYHAALAGQQPAVDLGGMMDGIAAAARSEYQSDRFINVIRILGPVVNDSTPEDIAAMLADSYAWTDQFDQAFALAGSIVNRNRSYIWLFTEACAAAIRSRRFDYAQKALSHAENLEPGTYRVAQFKGRLAERRGDKEEAIEYYREASEKTEHDPWPFFYYARALIRRGRADDALIVIDSGRELAKKLSGRGIRSFETALLSQELVALVLVGDYDAAKLILDALDRVPAGRPEMVLSTAFVRAFFTEDGAEKVKVYEEAISRLEPKVTHRAHVRAQTHLLRGRLCEAIDDLGRAEHEYERATSLDEHNVQMKLNLLKLLIKIARNAKSVDDMSSAVSAARKALAVAKQILKYNPSQQDALYAQQDLFHEFKIQ